MTCNNMFLEEDGYCTSCGENHFKNRDATSKANRDKKLVAATHRRELLEAERLAQIEAAIMADPLYREPRALIYRMAKDMDIKVKVVFRNRERSSYCSGSKNRNGEWVIVLGYQMIDNMAAKGYTEYKTLQYLVPTPRPTGVEAIKWLAVHEFAHAVDLEENGNIPGVAHGATYHEIYKSLIELYLS